MAPGAPPPRTSAGTFLGPVAHSRPSGGGPGSGLQAWATCRAAPAWPGSVPPPARRSPTLAGSVRMTGVRVKGHGSPRGPGLLPSVRDLLRDRHTGVPERGLTEAHDGRAARHRVSPPCTEN